MLSEKKMSRLSFLLKNASFLYFSFFHDFQYHAAFDTGGNKETDWPVMVEITSIVIDANTLLNRQKDFPVFPFILGP